MANLVSPNIRLVSVKVSLGGLPEKPVEDATLKPGATPAKTEAQPAKPKEEVKKEIELEGFVTGDRKSLNTMLAAYAMQLENSPMFQDVKVQKTNEESFRKATLLRFNIAMKAEGI